MSFLFAYGTLQPGLAPKEIAATVARLERVGEGWVAGTLYDLGEYPGARLSSASEESINGVVFQLPEDGRVLEELDAYEGFEADCPQASLFLRERTPVTMLDGRLLDCWVYVLGREPEGARVVAGGRFSRA